MSNGIDLNVLRNRVETKKFNIIKKTELNCNSKIFIEENCCICLTNKSNYIFGNCLHVCVCEECSKQLNKCPMCRDVINKFSIIYK